MLRERPTQEGAGAARTHVTSGVQHDFASAETCMVSTGNAAASGLKLLGAGFGFSSVAVLKPQDPF